MYDPEFDPDVADGPPRPGWRTTPHPILVGVAGVALAFGAWHALLRTLAQPTQDESTAEVTISGFEAMSPADSLVPSGVADSGTRPTRDHRGTARSTPAGSSSAAATENSSAETGMSPFRRSHPWAAVPGQPYYYPSRCSSTLQHPDLLFFRTQAEAQAGGFVPASDSGCG